MIEHRAADADPSALQARDPGRPSIGGPVVLAGVASFIVAGVLAVADRRSFDADRGVSWIAVSLGLLLIGVGLAILGIHRLGAFSFTLGRRGAKILATGLVLDGMIQGLSSAGLLKGPEHLFILLPGIVGVLSTMIGFGMTVLALVLAPGPSRRVGLLFVATVPVLGALSVYTGWGGDAGSISGVALVATVAGLLLAGFAGIGLVSSRRDPGST